MEPRLKAQDYTLKDYINVIKLRKSWFLIPFLIVLVISGVIAVFAPPVYQASSKILIEGQQIPTEFVQSAVNDYVEKQIETINQRIISRGKLTEIITRFDLYPKLRENNSMEKAIETMRRDIKLETLRTEVINQQSGRVSTAAVAFQLSYEGRDPDKVQKVANMLASLYLEENLKNRTENAVNTTEFLAAELSDLKNQIDQQEEKRTTLKEENAFQMPDMLLQNQQSVMQLEREIEETEQRITNNKILKSELEIKLAGIDPDRTDYGPAGQITDPKQRLEFLRTRYITLTSSLSEKHPDVIETKNELDSLEKERALYEALRQKQEQLDKLKEGLSAMKEEYPDNHSDVLTLTGLITFLENDIKQSEASGGGVLSADVKPPSNPAYINLASQIKNARIEIDALNAKKERLQTKLTEYRNRVEMTPLVESQLNSLTQDYDDARNRYQDVMAKLMKANTAETLEQKQKGQKFTVIDPAVFPEKSYKPNRLSIFLIGLVLSIGAGFGSASLKDIMDHSIRSEAELTQLTDGAVLSIISTIEDGEKKTRRSGRWREAFSTS